MTTELAGLPRSLRLVGDDLADGLRPEATPKERLTALQQCGLPIEDIARAIGVSENTIRNWASGEATPRRTGLFALDDLRAAAARLAELGLEPPRIGVWLLSRNTTFLEGRRPVDVLRDHPTEVLAAVEHSVFDEDPVLEPDRSVEPVDAGTPGGSG